MDKILKLEIDVVCVDEVYRYLRINCCGYKIRLWKGFIKRIIKRIF